ncbi:MAG: hypothetical protein AB4206_16915 [Xenococcaceae cyanobacterium]
MTFFFFTAIEIDTELCSCMLPSKAIGKTVDSIRENNNQDFSNLMPRPGWHNMAGFLLVFLCGSGK